MLQEQVPHVEDRAASRLAAAADDEGDERRDLLGRHHVAVDHRVAQLGDDVHRHLVAVGVVEVARLRSAGLDQSARRTPRAPAGRPALGVALGAAEAVHHRVVPVEEAVAGVVGEAEHLAHDADRELVGEGSPELDRVAAGRRVELGGAALGSNHDSIISSARRCNAGRRFVSARADQVAAVDVAAAAVLDAAQLELGVAEHAARGALGDRVEPGLVQVAGLDVLVARDPVAVVQLVVEHRVVVAQDAVGTGTGCACTPPSRRGAGRSAACRRRPGPCRRPARPACTGSPDRRVRVVGGAGSWSSVA